MKIKSEYQISTIDGQSIVIARGKKQAALIRILSLNSNAVWVWEQLIGIEFTEEDVICLLLCRFDIDLPTAVSDVRKWIEILKRHQIIE